MVLVLLMDLVDPQVLLDLLDNLDLMVNLDLLVHLDLADNREQHFSGIINNHTVRISREDKKDALEEDGGDKVETDIELDTKLGQQREIESHNRDSREHIVLEV